MKEALKLALEALEYASTGNRRPEIIGPAITAIKAALAQPAQEPVAWPVLGAEEREALERFNETCEDDQDYDVPKPMMKRLSAIGVVYSAGFGRYGLTEFGHAALAQDEASSSRAAQEPVAWLDEEKKIIYWHNTHETDDYHGFRRTTPLYTTPQQRLWVGLSAEEIASIPLDTNTLQTVEKLLKGKNK